LKEKSRIESLTSVEEVWPVVEVVEMEEGVPDESSTGERGWRVEAMGASV